MRKAQIVLCLVLMAGLWGCISTGQKSADPNDVEHYKALKDFNDGKAGENTVTATIDPITKQFTGFAVSFSKGTVAPVRRRGFVERVCDMADRMLERGVPFLGGSSRATYNVDSAGNVLIGNSTEDHKIATGGESGVITGPSDSHDATSEPQAPVIVRPEIVNTATEEG